MNAALALTLVACARPAPPVAAAPRAASREPARQPEAPIVAVEDLELSATIVRCDALRYPQPDEDPERGEHVRAGSGLAALDTERMIIAQDDMGYLVLRERDGSLRALALPARDGRRRFEAALGNLHIKPDLEACAALGDGTVAAFGSGTLPERTGIATVDAAGVVTWRVGAALYERLRAHPFFVGGQLNVEGAVVVGDRLRLFHRGNGQAAGHLAATLDLDRVAFLAWLRDAGPVPAVLAVQAYDLGRSEGVDYGFTDATHGEAEDVLYLAGAEDSESPLVDGRVVGVRIGVIRGQSARWTTVQTPDGGPSLLKLEGLAPDPGHPGTYWAVSDVDAPETPALLCQLRLRGPWNATRSAGAPSNG